MELEPESASAHFSLGTALLETRQSAPALKEFQEAVRLDPSAEHHYALAACLISIGRESDALAEMQVATRLDPEKQLYHAREQELLRLMQSAGTR